MLKSSIIKITRPDAPLNDADHVGSFSKDGVSSIVSEGPAWWWCDHTFGIKNVLESVNAYSVLSEFVGMTTDSRSVLSFVRHDYFRRNIHFHPTDAAEDIWGRRILDNVAKDNVAKCVRLYVMTEAFCCTAVYNNLK